MPDCPRCREKSAQWHQRYPHVAMSTPDEKRQALIAVAVWLLRLPSVKRLPKSVREQAIQLMRHYPNGFEIAHFKMLGEKDT